MENNDKYREMLRTFDMWMTEQENNNTLGSCLKRQEVKKAGVYGYGVLGRHLLYELERADIQIAWIMDKRNLRIPYPLLHPADKDSVPEVDLIIVTAISDFKEIERALCAKTDSPVVSLQEIVEEMRIYRLWMTEEENDNKIVNYLLERNMKKVGLYGYNFSGKQLSAEMEKADIEVVWVTDRNQKSLSGRVSLTVAEESIASDVDIVIITIWLVYREIEEKISAKISSPIISLQEIVEEMKFERERYWI